MAAVTQFIEIIRLQEMGNASLITDDAVIAIYIYTGYLHRQPDLL